MRLGSRISVSQKDLVEYETSGLMDGGSNPPLPTGRQV